MEVAMGRIVASVTISNLEDKEKKIRIDALVDTGVSHMILPVEWKERLGDLEEIRTVELETATQKTEQGSVCGPVRLQIEGFKPIFTEIVFPSFCFRLEPIRVCSSLLLFVCL